MQPSIEERLLSIKRSIELAKTTKAQLEGRLSAEYDKLKSLGCKSTEDAELKIKSLSEESKKLQSEIEKGVKKFEEKYGF